VDVKRMVKDTLDLRKLMLSSLDDLVNKRITPHDARGRAMLGRTILETLRIEMIAAREGLRVYDPVSLEGPSSTTIEGIVES
jgi:hypothetical protein